MKILLVEGAPGAGATVERELVDAGHRVVGCDPADSWAPCRGLDVVGECPLDEGDVDVAVVARAAHDMTPSERGALCAASRRVPVVLTGDPRHAVSFGPGTHVAGSDLLAACGDASTSGLAHAAAVRRDLLMHGVITSDDVDGPNPPITFEVRRDPRRLRLTVTMPADEPRGPGITKAAQEALRRFDRWSKVIDVVVAHR